MACAWMGGGGAGATHGIFDIFRFQMSISLPFGLHFESNSHPWDELIGTHNGLYYSTKRLQRFFLSW